MLAQHMERHGIPAHRTPAKADIGGASLWPIQISNAGASYAQRVRSAPLTAFTPRSPPDTHNATDSSSVPPSVAPVSPVAPPQPKGQAPRNVAPPPTATPYMPPARPSGRGAAPAGLSYGDMAVPPTPPAFSSPPATERSHGIAPSLLMSPIAPSAAPLDPQAPGSLGALLGAVTASIMASAPAGSMKSAAERRIEQRRKREKEKRELEELMREQSEAEKKAKQQEERQERLMLKHTLMRAKMMSKQARATALAMQSAAAEAKRELGGLTSPDDPLNLGLDESLARARAVAAAARKAAAEMKDRAARIRERREERASQHSDAYSDAGSYNDGASVARSERRRGRDLRGPGARRGNGQSTRRPARAKSRRDVGRDGKGAVLDKERDRGGDSEMGDKKQSALGRFASFFTPKKKDDDGDSVASGFSGGGGSKRGGSSARKNWRRASMAAVGQRRSGQSRR